MATAKKRRPVDPLMLQFRINVVVTTPVLSPTLAEALEAGKSFKLTDLITFKPGVAWLDGSWQVTGVFSE